MALLSGCVHAQVERVGRSILTDGTEGRAPIVAQAPGGYEEVAVVTVDADGVATPERLTRHLQRRAALLGCAAITLIDVGGTTARAACLHDRNAVRPVVATMVAAPSAELVARAERAGAAGAALLNVFAQLERRRGEERAWPLRWYLTTYPDSPFRAEVLALFVPARDGAGAPTHVRAASAE